MGVSLYQVKNKQTNKKFNLTESDLAKSLLSQMHLSLDIETPFGRRIVRMNLHTCEMTVA